MFGHDEPQTTNNSNATVMDNNVPTPATDAPQSDTPTVDAVDTPHVDQAVAPHDEHRNDDLLTIKQDALKQLGPLVSHLDQTPEEKFRTTMMMIQATDNKDLIKDAYDAAQNISNEKTRAQALLDIVNEINYFTQHPADNE